MKVNVHSAPTGKQVLSWFTGALQGTKMCPPSFAACEKMAARIHDQARRWEEYSPSYPELGKQVRDSANMFLKHLPNARTKSEQMMTDAYGVPAIQADLQKVLDDMQKAEDAVQQLLKTCDWATKPGNPKYELTHHMRALAIIAWHESGIREIPDSVSYSDAPMCKIVTSALSSVGVVCSRDAVSKTLLGERGGPKLSASDKAFFTQAVKKDKTTKLKSP